MEIRPIHTDADYRAVLREVSAYFENEPEPELRLMVIGSRCW